LGDFLVLNLRRFTKSLYCEMSNYFVFLKLREVFRFGVPLWYRGLWSQCLHRVWFIFCLVFVVFTSTIVFCALPLGVGVRYCLFCVCFLYRLVVVRFLGFNLGRFTQLGNVHVCFRSFMVDLSDDCVSKT
jgi:hypothetical protein